MNRKDFSAQDILSGNIEEVIPQLEKPIKIKWKKLRTQQIEERVKRNRAYDRAIYHHKELTILWTCPHVAIGRRLINFIPNLDQPLRVEKVCESCRRKRSKKWSYTEIKKGRNTKGK